MKGLILKDLYMSAKYLRTYLVLSVVFAATSVMDDNLFFLFYPCILFSMVPINLLSYDESSKWDSYCACLPCTRAQIVSAKYGIGLIFQGLAILMMTLAQLLRLRIHGGESRELVDTILPTMVILCCVSSALPLPPIFKLGVEKGRMVYYAIVGVACAGSSCCRSC